MRQAARIRGISPQHTKDMVRKSATLKKGKVNKIMKFSVSDILLHAIDRSIVGMESEDAQITLPFSHDVTTTWSLSDLDYKNPNDTPNLNLTVVAMILSLNIETTVGDHSWSLIDSTLTRLGFTDLSHHYFELAEKINYPAMSFGRSIEKVNGKYVVAAIFRGSASVPDFISDLKAEPGGFHDAGIHALTELKAYLGNHGLTKDNTTLFIAGHSYGAAIASLVAINSTDLAERDSIFCYSYATPNYIRHGLTGDGMKMFCFASNEDVVPQVPVGPALDKTGAVIRYDRTDIKLRHPDQYERFLTLYKYFRDNDFNDDSDFLPKDYSYKMPLGLPVNSILLRNHMPYTYMALVLSELPDIQAYSYICGPAKERKRTGTLEWQINAGEVYKLPAALYGKEGPSLIWETADKAIASISEKGMLKGKKAGKTALTVTAGNGGKAVLELCVEE